MACKVYRFSDLELARLRAALAGQSIEMDDPEPFIFETLDADAVTIDRARRSHGRDLIKLRIDDIDSVEAHLTIDQARAAALTLLTWAERMEFEHDGYPDS